MKLKLSTKILLAMGGLILLASIIFTIYIGNTVEPARDSNTEIQINNGQIRIQTEDFDTVIITQ
ncbi:MAG: hypothetical protein PHO12_06650 [Bacteroidales bacterium]|nr:hypothetical protein [Bacteroidales bacterium]MDD4683804.1 hypothetical protein [Bacteroidales bacterium]